MRTLPLLAAFFGNNSDSNFRLTIEGSGSAPVFQLWNQTREIWQTIQLDGADGLERLVIE